MADDIVARLREIEARYSMQSLLTEAAAEIERLREALRLEQEELAACCIDRRETQRERDEARREAKRRGSDCFKQKSMTDDIVADLRAWGSNLFMLRAADEIERLRKGGCARDQRTTQFCAEAVELQREVERLRAELVSTTNRLTSERDDIRRRYCLVGISDSDRNGHLFIARVNGWEGLFDDWEDGKDE